MGMKLIMEQDAIEQAIEAYVREMIPGLDDSIVIRMDLAATRGPAGHTAEVRLLSQEEADAPVDVTPKRSVPAEIETPLADAAGVPDVPVEEAESVSEEPKPKRAYNRKVQVSGTKSLGLTEPQKTDTETPIETPATEEVEAEQVADTAPVAEETTVDPVEEPTADSVEEESEAAAEVAVEETPAPVRKSLFANLNKG